MFQDACVAAGIPAVTFWAAVPHYVSQPPNPKATVALLRRVEEVLDIEVPLAELPAQAEEWEQAVTEMTAEDEEIADYVASLEQRGDAEVDVNEALSKVDGDALAAEFERYLRRRGALTLAVTERSAESRTGRPLGRVPLYIEKRRPHRFRKGGTP